MARRSCRTTNGVKRCSAGSAAKGAYIPTARRVKLHAGELVKKLTPGIKRRLAKAKTARAAKKILFS